MILFTEAGIRGGVSMISNRYGKANNKYMENYNSDEESKFITCLDANNFYGWGMSQKLPYKNFRWVNEKKLVGLDPTLLGAEDETIVIYYKWILNIQKSCTTHIMITLLHQKTLLLII